MAELDFALHVLIKGVAERQKQHLHATLLRGDGLQDGRVRDDALVLIPFAEHHVAVHQFYQSDIVHCHLIVFRIAFKAQKVPLDRGFVSTSCIRHCQGRAQPVLSDHVPL